MLNATADDQRLLKRAELLVSMGEIIGGDLRAGLDDPLQTALTLVRASDRITRFCLELDGVTVKYSG